MTYTTTLGDGRSLWVNSLGEQTQITLQTSSTGQQQQQSCTLTVGSWVMPPMLLQIGTGLVLRVEGDRGQQFVQIQGSQMQRLSTPPDLSSSHVLALHQVDATPSNLPPMAPLEPLKMGTMEMQMKPMQMRMGNMAMSMNSPSNDPPTQRFCSQCGKPVAPSDRFCAACGHQLT